MVDPEPAGQPPPPKGPPVTSATLAALVVAVGFLLVLENLAGVGVTATLVLGVVLAVLGGGLVVSGLVGRALGLIPLSLFALLLMPVAPLIDNTLSGGIGDRRVRVTSNDVLEESYTLGMGSMKLDLSGVTVADGETVEVGVDVGAGYAEIVVPADVRVEVRATSLFGYVEVFNAHDQGVDNEIRQIRRPQTVTSAGETSAGDPPGNGDGDAGADAGAGAASDTSNEGSLVIVADVTFGYVEVDDRG
jgi:hypothetical protein